MQLGIFFSISGVVVFVLWCAGDALIDGDEDIS
jgi:hypothetical protein